MDPDTGAAGYMICGGIAGGSAAFDVVASLAGLALLVWAIYDTVTVAMAFLAAASPIMAGILYVLYVLNIINVLMTLDTIISFWETGDYKYASELMTNLIMNIIFFGVFKLLDKFGPDILDMFQNIRNRMAGLADVEERFGKDAADLAARYGPDAIKAVSTYGDDAVRAITKYGEDGLTAIYYYGDRLAENIAKYGDDAVECAIKYGDNAINAMKNGIDPSIMKELDNLGIKPADYDKFKIINKEAANAAAEYGKAARSAGIVEPEIPVFAEFINKSAGQFGGTGNAIQAFKYLSSGDFTSFANMIDLSTPAGKAVFWSGDKAAAMRYAESIKGRTLELTAGGGILDNWDWLSKKFPTWGDESKTDLRELWIAVSDRYAKLVEGPVTVVRPGGEAGTGGYIWNNVEYKVLNDRHITINYVDSTTVK